jgi:K+-sensing histidine kinase KdpD
MISRARTSFADRRLPSLAGVAVAVVSLAVATGLAALARGQLGVSNAAIVYLLAVVAVGMGYGSWLAVGTSVV